MRYLFALNSNNELINAYWVEGKGQGYNDTKNSYFHNKSERKYKFDMKEYLILEVYAPNDFIPSWKNSQNLLEKEYPELKL